MGLFDIFRHLRRIRKRQLEEEGATRQAQQQHALPWPPPKLGPIDEFLATAGYAKNASRFNQRMPIVVDRMVAEGLHHILMIYANVGNSHGETETDRLFAPFFAEMHAEAEKYRAMPTAEGARAAISILAEKTTAFANTLRAQLGSDRGLLLASQLFVKALQRLQEETQPTG